MDKKPYKTLVRRRRGVKMAPTSSLQERINKMQPLTLQRENIPQEERDRAMDNFVGCLTVKTRDVPQSDPRRILMEVRKR